MKIIVTTTYSELDQAGVDNYFKQLCHKAPEIPQDVFEDIREGGEFNLVTENPNGPGRAHTRYTVEP